MDWQRSPPVPLRPSSHPPCLLLQVQACCCHLSHLATSPTTSPSPSLVVPPSGLVAVPPRGVPPRLVGALVGALTVTSTSTETLTSFRVRSTSRTADQQELRQFTENVHRSRSFGLGYGFWRSRHPTRGSFITPRDFVTVTLLAIARAPVARVALASRSGISRVSTGVTSSHGL